MRSLLFDWAWAWPVLGLLGLLLFPGAASAAPPKGILGTTECFDLAHVPATASATWFVRPDGGDADRCTGRANAPYPGTGLHRDCAFAHPFDALPPGAKPRIAGGDVLVIAPGAYRMGYGAPGTKDACSRTASYDCVMPPIPSGPSPARPTRIVGALDGHGALPELWGAERAWFVVNLKGTANAEVSCLEITDHSDCVEYHPGKLTCERDRAPYGNWAATGILAVDARHIVLRSLDIHGLASSGITAGRVADWTLVDVFVTANGLVGWLGDLGEPSGDAGALTFRRVTFDWNGCGENARREPIGCWSEEAGGYGAGLGTGTTGGNWRFEDSRFIHNVGDGLDLGSLDGTGTVAIDRVWSEGNGGHQLRARGAVTVTRTVAVGGPGGEPIRLEPLPGRSLEVERSTVIGQTGALLGVVSPPARADLCGRLRPISVAASILIGNDLAAPVYKECGGLEGAGPPVEVTGSVLWRTRGDVCAGNMCVDPELDPATLAPRPGSPAVGRGAR